MFKKKDEKDVVSACGCCEHSIVMELTGTVLCKRKGRIKEVSDDHSCKHFELDVLKLNPRPKKIYEPGMD